jgi:hypothetical protein
MLMIGLLLIAAAMGLGIYGLVHRGLELLIGIAMLVLVFLGFWALLTGIGL